MPNRSMFSMIISIISLFILTACGGNTPAATATATPKPIEPISIQLSWVHTIEFAGFQIAERDGLYAAQGIDIDLRSAFNADGDFVPAISAVVSGEADFGVASSYDLMKARAEGQKVVAIAAIYQRSPISLISLKGSNIITPRDLIGKRVTVSGSVAVYFDALLKSVGIDKSQIEISGENTYSMEPLLSGEIDAYGAYLTNQPSIFKRQGIEYNLLVFADYAIDGYSNVIFTSEEMIQNRPEVVEGFLRATFDGFRRALDNPEDAASISLSYNPELIYEDELANMLVSVPLLYPTGSEVGMMTDQLWQLGYTIMSEAGELPVDFEVSQAYTMTFLNKIYNR